MRFSRVFLGLVSAFGVVALLSINAQAQTTSRQDRVEQAAADAGSQALAERRRFLFDRMMADPSDLDVAFEYAALSARAGDLEGAIATLERMLIFAPGLPRLQLELGALYYRLGAYDTARIYFDQALAAPEVPAEVRERVESYRLRIDKASAPTQFSGSVAVGARYQTNANAAPESRLITLNGIDFLLDESAVSAPDVNGFIAARMRVSHDLENQGDRLEVGLTTFGALYEDRRELNVGMAELTAGPVFNLERFRISNTTFGVYGILGGVILAGDPYLLSGGIGANLVTTNDDGTRLSLRTEYRREDYRDTTLRPLASERTGNRYRAVAEVQRPVADNLVVMSAVEGERRDARRDHHSFWAAGASVGARLTFAAPLEVTEAPWTVGVTAGYLRRVYDEPNGMPMAQRDNEASVEAMLAVPFAESWSLMTSAGYRRVNSNNVMRRFDNISGTVSLMRQF